MKELSDSDIREKALAFRRALVRWASGATDRLPKGTTVLELAQRDSGLYGQLYCTLVDFDAEMGERLDDATKKGGGR